MFRSFDVYKLAAQQMIDKNFVLFDTETTGVGPEDEIVELGIIDCRGNVLYDGMFKPEQRMNPAASKVSGITDEMLADKPLFKDEFWKIMSMMNQSGVIAFNEAFDERMFYQTARKYGLDTEVLDGIFKVSYCAESLYDHYIGYDKTKLEIACEVEGIELVQTHRATDDCVMTLELLKRVADRERTPDYDRYCEAKAKATGKTVEEVARPLGAGKQKDSAFVEFAKLFNEGKSVEEIAGLKKVQVRMVEERLVDAFKNDYIKSVDFMIQPEYEEAVRAIIQSPGWNGRFTPIKNAMPDECSWCTIRAVVAKYRKEQKVMENAEPSLEDKLANAMARSVSSDSAEIRSTEYSLN